MPDAQLGFNAVLMSHSQSVLSQLTSSPALHDGRVTVPLTQLQLLLLQLYSLPGRRAQDGLLTLRESHSQPVLSQTYETPSPQLGSSTVLDTHEQLLALQSYSVPEAHDGLLTLRESQRQKELFQL